MIDSADMNAVRDLLKEMLDEMFIQGVLTTARRKAIMERIERS